MNIPKAVQEASDVDDRFCRQERKFSILFNLYLLMNLVCVKFHFQDFNEMSCTHYGKCGILDLM